MYDVLLQNWQCIISIVYRTPHTKIPRYTYIDPDYALTPNEEAEKLKNQQIYIDYIDKLRRKRIHTEKNR